MSQGTETNCLLPMDKKHKLCYDPPRVAVVAFKVENGLYASFESRTAGTLLPFGDATWDAPSTSSQLSLFGDGDWTGGSSFSNNNSFGSSSWDE